MKKLIFTFFATFALIAMMAQVDRSNVLVEVGTGTGCPYCPGAAMGLHDLYENGDPVSGIEYHNYNSNDPFKTPQAPIRCSYYGISGYPTAQFDGEWAQHEGGSSSSSLYSTYIGKVNQRMAIQTEFTVEITGENTGDLYNIKVTANKLAEYTGSDLVVHVCITETDIAYSWQGQSTIDYTERTMIPDAYGTDITFPSNNSMVEVELNFTFDNTWVKENCEIIAWVQDNSNKNVLTSVGVMLPDLDPGFPTWLADFTAEPTQICESGTAHFHDNSIGDVLQYQWFFDGGYPETSGLMNPNVYYAEPGVYDVELVIYDGSRYDTANKVGFIQVNNPPDVSFAPVEELCNEDWDPYLLTQGSPAGGIYSGDFVTEDMYFHPTEAGVGEYTITYTYEEGGCEGTADQTVTVVNCVGVEEVAADVALEVYPNPSNGIFTVNIDAANFENAELKVVDMVGKVVYSLDNMTISGEKSIDINLSNNPAGIYFVQIKNEQQNVSKKIFLK